MAETLVPGPAEVLTAPDSSTATDYSAAPQPWGSGEPTFHPLTFLVEGEEVTVGRADQTEYIVLPADAAALLRRLSGGSTIEAAAKWYADTYGEPVDVAAFVADLDQLGFLKRDGEPEVLAAPVRWQSMGKAIFGPLGAVAYLALFGCWIAACVRTPQLLPHPRNLFFMHYMSIMVAALFLSQLPLVLLHEAAHTLAGRRLGLRSRLSVGRRFYFVVFQTTMDGLIGVPRGKRYLPILAGMLFDAGAIAALSLLADAGRTGAGQFDGLARFLLATAYLTWLRLLWQLCIFLQTDLYYLVVTVCGCTNLHATAKQQLRNRVRRLTGRPPAHDPADWHPRDRSVSAWYSWVVVAGYVACLVSALTSVLPVMSRLATNVIRTFTDHAHRSPASMLDSAILLAMFSGELGLVGFLHFRERRATSVAGRRG